MLHKTHIAYASWIFGSILLLFLIGVFAFAPETLPLFKHKILTYLTALISYGFNSQLLAAQNIRASEYIHKRHDVTVLLYQLVLRAKYRRVVFGSEVDVKLRDVCLKIEERQQLKFLEIGTDEEHVHFVVQSVRTYPVTKLVTRIKSITAREIFRSCAHVKKQLWGGEFWSDGYFASTVGKHGNEDMIKRYVQNQGKQYTKLYDDKQLALF